MGLPKLSLSKELLMPAWLAQHDNENGMMEAACPQAVSADSANSGGAPHLHPHNFLRRTQSDRSFLNEALDSDYLFRGHQEGDDFLHVAHAPEYKLLVQLIMAYASAAGQQIYPSAGESVEGIGDRGT